MAVTIGLDVTISCRVLKLWFLTCVMLFCTSGATVGVVLGVLGPTAVMVGWLVVTYRYRLSKRKLVAEVVKRLQVDDIADSSAVALDPAPRPPRIIVSATRQLAAAGVLRLHVSSWV